MLNNLYSFLLNIVFFSLLAIAVVSTFMIWLTHTHINIQAQSTIGYFDTLAYKKSINDLYIELAIAIPSWIIVLSIYFI